LGFSFLKAGGGLEAPNDDAEDEEEEEEDESPSTTLWDSPDVGKEKGLGKEGGSPQRGELDVVLFSF